jgi:hypothetical protein
MPERFSLQMNTFLGRKSLSPAFCWLLASLLELLSTEDADEPVFWYQYTAQRMKKLLRQKSF